MEATLNTSLYTIFIVSPRGSSSESSNNTFSPLLKQACDRPTCSWPCVNTGFKDQDRKGPNKELMQMAVGLRGNLQFRLVAKLSPSAFKETNRKVLRARDICSPMYMLLTTFTVLSDGSDGSVVRQALKDPLHYYLDQLKNRKGELPKMERGEMKEEMASGFRLLISLLHSSPWTSSYGVPKARGADMCRDPQTVWMSCLVA